jgi:hypothetical protein
MDHARCTWVLFPKRFNGGVNCQGIAQGLFMRKVRDVGDFSLAGAAAFLGSDAPCMLNQDSAHGFRGRSVKMGTAVPSHVAATNQAHIRLVNQRGGLKRVLSTFAGHVPFGHVAE